jgi:hypothetical protein
MNPEVIFKCTEEDIWTEEGWGDGRMEKVA